jgi:hypothetical protein
MDGGSSTLVPNVVDVLNRALADFSQKEGEIFTRLLQKFIAGISVTPEPDTGADRSN